MSIGSVMLSSHPLLPSSFPFNLFSIRVFSSESVLYIRWPRYWSFSLSISLSNEYSGLISFQMWCFNVFLTDDECLMNVHSTKHRKAKRIRKKTPFLLPQEKHQLQYGDFPLHPFSLGIFSTLHFEIQNVSLKNSLCTRNFQEES